MTDTHSVADEVRALGYLERHVIDHFVHRKPVARDLNAAFDQASTFGERTADRVAAFGGSWTFIGLFVGAMAVWIAINVAAGRAFDPYPFILLNLVLSCLAALQAPVIMMSQNRQSAKDRLDAQHDYEVNMKAEMEIVALHFKIDELREKQWATLLEIQQRQIDLLQRLTAHEGDEGRKKQSDQERT
jgi:uncharacterized membrane protein